LVDDLRIEAAGFRIGLAGADAFGDGRLLFFQGFDIGDEFAQHRGRAGVMRRSFAPLHRRPPRAFRAS